MAYGSVLTERQDAPERRKRRGAFFTPSKLADFISSRLISEKSNRVFEPSCGEAEFLLASCRRLRELGATEQDVRDHVHGCELHAPSAKAAVDRLRKHGFACQITVGDFLQYQANCSFDVIVGNPPYVRFQVIDEASQREIRRIAERSGIKLSLLSSLWVPFLLHSCEFLSVGGRIGMVLPAELLTVNYAASIRSFLLNRFSRIELFTFEERIFPEVQEEVVLLFAYGFQSGVSDSISWYQCKDLDSAYRSAPQERKPASNGERWTNVLAPDTSLTIVQRLIEDGYLVELKEWGRLSLGSVTGCNSFFVLSKHEVEELGLVDGDWIAACPPGSNHLRKVTFNRDDWLELDGCGMKTRLFWPVNPSPAACQYIQMGEQRGVSARYKCRKRSPWWRVPVTATPDAFVTYMNAHGPNICANDANVTCVNSVHGLVFNEDMRDVGKCVLPMAAFSSVSLFSAELSGRSYGGGVLKLEPREAKRWLVPSFDHLVDRYDQLMALRDRIDGFYEERRFSSISGCVDAALWKGILEDDEIDTMRCASDQMRLRRQRRAKEAKS